MSIPRRAIPPQFVHTRSRWAGSYDARQLTGVTEGVGGITWPANLGIYVPFMLPWPFPVRQVYWMNGSTVTASTVDFGIYTPDGARLYSTGPTAQVGTLAPQSVTASPPLLLPPGPYLLALAASGGAGRLGGGTNFSTEMLRHGGLLQEAGISTLPAFATFAAVTSVAVMPMFGITRSTKTM